ncbi:MAG: PD40 domain-containing protein [Kouleothrix sp.]|nr:PD40 domain-containing protein [Kouleothrix sp.]
MEQGYYRFPTIHRDTVAFVCEGDLWRVPAGGGVARRLTTNPGQALTPAFSPDGALLAFAGRDEGGPEVYVMPAEGGPSQRLTFLGAQSEVAGWSPDGRSIVFASSAAQPFASQYQLYAVDREGGEPRRLPTGPARSVSFGPDGAMVIGRNTTDLARWKRYRGGLAGDLWVDAEGDGDWRRLTRIAGNVALPRWVAERVYFVSDHEGVGNLYSCRPSGDDLRRHTHHADYYVRHPSTDGSRIVYHAGADLFLFDPATDRAEKIAVELYSSRSQRKRKFVSAEKYLQGYDPHPGGRAIALTVRGRPFTLGAWDGPALQHGDLGSVRYRLAAWLDERRLVVVGDSGGEETLEIHHADASAAPERLEDLPIGRPVGLAPAPGRAAVALANHRNELILVDLAARSARVLDRSLHETIHGVAWSPDGRWLAYGFSNTQQTSIIKLCDVESGETFEVTRPVLRDTSPAFDPDGKYLYFISHREFNPVYDSLHFDLNFPQGTRPYLVTLRADLPSPFAPRPSSADEPAAPPAEGAPKPEPDERPALRIDLDGIADRVVAFPVPVGLYSQILGIKGKALFSSRPVEDSLGAQVYGGGPPPAKHKIESYDFEERSRETLVEGVTSFDISRDAKTLVYRSGNRLRAIKAGEKPKDDGPPGRKSGWLDLGRVKVSVDPGAEWEQMYREAWRLQRDHFWNADMSGVDWQAVYQRYLPLLRRVATRAEFSDLMWEMQGELGTSHAYEVGGDYPPEPHYDQGLLGADLRYDEATDSYVIERIARGDVWDEAGSSPLVRPGVNIRPGDRLVAVNGRRVGRTVAPGALLVNQAGADVLLTVAGGAGSPGDDATRTVAVRTLRSETPVRYREWVESNRRRVHDATDGRVGYVHIPDMGPRGYAEFHRSYLAEVAREALIVDVRFNGGGHVSQLIIEKLARRRLGYDVQRWGQPAPYPSDSVMGPLVAITNEQAGSDGDIFSHVFKLMNLGPLIGKRTWGGVIGMNVRHRLVDGSITTQPEFSFWFNDVGWQVENYGTDPDIEIDIRPQDHIAGHDSQLERALAEVQRLLAEHPPTLPEFGERPRLGLPKLPGI